MLADQAGISISYRPSERSLLLRGDDGRRLADVALTTGRIEVTDPTGTAILGIETGLRWSWRRSHRLTGCGAARTLSSRSGLVHATDCDLAFRYPIFQGRAAISECIRRVDRPAASIVGSSLGVRLEAEQTADLLPCLAIYLVSMTELVPPPSVHRYLIPRGVG